ncbi:DoxX family protein [uncultured Flavobacterium sp.]|uniref:DoxX family protein n=1 Tax=uncultured Flavobacterium sp. TaxID=165435 RepID=UPI0030EC8CD7|tara:strand:- start:46047 stop:46436 length:390 start_codon:yes stop_codon:yes gene_type:complete
MKSSLFSWLLRIVVAAILVQTLYFKFTGAAESIYIFKTLGMEPYGRIGSGIIELVSSIFILIPRTTLLGALLGLGVMIGAIVSHVFVLGIEVQNDGGTLFMLALITFLCCSILVYQNRNKITDLLKLKI